MSYVIEAVVVCDGCGSALGHSGREGDDFRSLAWDVEQPRPHGARTIKTGRGEKHLCETCEQGGDDE